MSPWAEGFLEFARPLQDSMPSFEELIHDRSAFTKEPDWLPQEFVYLCKDEWQQEEVRGTSCTDFLSKPGFKLAWKKTDMATDNSSRLHIEYAVPHYESCNVCWSPFNAVQTIHVREAEWRHAFVFHLLQDEHKLSQQRHQPHFVRFVGSDKIVEPLARAYRVVTSNQSRLDFVSAVPEQTGYGYADECVGEFISYLQGYHSGRQ